MTFFESMWSNIMHPNKDITVKCHEAVFYTAHLCKATQ
jgi:hypothetical protein